MCHSLIFVVVRTISTEWTIVFHISLLGAANTVAVCTLEHGRWVLIQYSLRLDKMLHRTVLTQWPAGMTGVTLGGKNCLALSYP